MSFTLDTSQAPALSVDTFDSSIFYYTNIPVVSNGSIYTREVGFGHFFNFENNLYEFGVGQSVTVQFGGVTIGTSYPTAAFFSNNVALFTGTSNAPAFLPGVYIRPTDGILTITNQTAVTPEPSTFALLGTGLLGAAALLRRRLS